MTDGESLDEAQMDALMQWICEGLQMPSILSADATDDVVETRLYEDFDSDVTCFMSDWRIGVLLNAQRIDEATADALVHIRVQWESLSRQRSIQEHRESDELQEFASLCDSLSKRVCAGRE